MPRHFLFELRILLRKNAPKFSPKMLSLDYLVGPKKNPAKFPRNCPQILSAKTQKKLTDELLQVRRENVLAPLDALGVYPLQPENVPKTQQSPHHIVPKKGSQIARGPVCKPHLGP